MLLRGGILSTGCRCVLPGTAMTGVQQEHLHVREGGTPESAEMSVQAWVGSQRPLLGLQSPAIAMTIYHTCVIRILTM